MKLSRDRVPQCPHLPGKFHDSTCSANRNLTNNLGKKVGWEKDYLQSSGSMHRFVYVILRHIWWCSYKKFAFDEASDHPLLPVNIHRTKYVIRSDWNSKAANCPSAMRYSADSGLGNLKAWNATSGLCATYADDCSCIVHTTCMPTVISIPRWSFERGPVPGISTRFCPVKCWSSKERGAGELLSLTL